MSYNTNIRKHSMQILYDNDDPKLFFAVVAVVVFLLLLLLLLLLLYMNILRTIKDAKIFAIKCISFK